MTYGFYIEIEMRQDAVRGTIPGGMRHVAARFIDAVHMVNAGSEDRDRIAIALNGMCEGTGNSNWANTMRAFASTPGPLEALLDHPILRGLKTIEGLEVFEVDEVPSDAQWRVYIRSRKEGKSTPAYVHRTLNRAQRKMAERMRRGEKVINPAAGYAERLSKLTPEPSQREAYGHLQMRSSSTGQRFSLFIRAVDGADGPTDNLPNVYGLSNPSQPAPVPDF